MSFRFGNATGKRVSRNVPRLSPCAKVDVCTFERGRQAIDHAACVKPRLIVLGFSTQQEREPVVRDIAAIGSPSIGTTVTQGNVAASVGGLP